ncbi:MAG TPA: hypothetical protein VFW40_08345, partial [Capsulimonadaceae bacterium]|nr:hypothetical protein [Capsulimonadaceae bacterium]
MLSDAKLSAMLFDRASLLLRAGAVIALLLLALTAFSWPAYALTTGLAHGDATAIACPRWKPTWEGTPLPNGRSRPYIRIPFDKADFRDCSVAPVLMSGLPVVHMYLKKGDGSLQPFAIENEIAGPEAPAPASARVFWNEPLGGFRPADRMVVFLQAKATADLPSGVPTGQMIWLRFDLPGAIPTIDRSGLGPMPASASGNYLPNEQMLNGSTAPAFHASLRVGLASLSPNPQSDRIYVLSDNLLSSREQDASTQIRLAAGVVRGLPSKEQDVMPNISGEAWVQSNQAASNQATGVSLGRLVLGRRWNGPVGHDFLYAALTPQLQLHPLQYTYLFRRDLRLDPGFTEKSFVDPSAAILLSPFFIGLRRGQT